MTTALEAFFAGRVHEGGRALRRTTLRHTHLADAPLAIVMWRLGGERFRAAAIAWGPVGGPFKMTVAGEPRNRDLYFAALAPFAADLCDLVRSTAANRVARTRGTRTELLPASALQIVVANRTTVGALGLLGRYLAYLSDRSGVAPDPLLVEAGKHLRFYAAPLPDSWPSDDRAARPVVGRALGHAPLSPRAGQPRSTRCADRAGDGGPRVRGIGGDRADRTDRARAHRGHRPSNH